MQLKKIWKSFKGSYVIMVLLVLILLFTYSFEEVREKIKSHVSITSRYFEMEYQHHPDENMISSSSRQLRRKYDTAKIISLPLEKEINLDDYNMSKEERYQKNVPLGIRLEYPRFSQRFGKVRFKIEVLSGQVSYVFSYPYGQDVLDMHPTTYYGIRQSFSCIEYMNTMEMLQSMDSNCIPVVFSDESLSHLAILMQAKAGTTIKISSLE